MCRKNVLTIVAMVVFAMAGTADAAKNTFLVPIPSGACWQDFAYLAAVPASAKTNTAGPSVIALDGNGTVLEEITHYLTLYAPDNTYTLNTGGSSSLDIVTCGLAQTHWTTTTYVVLVGNADYENALCASALAARLEVPLMFFSASTGLSSATLNVIDNNLQCTTALTVNGNSTVTSQLSGIGVSQTSLANANAIFGWIVSNIGAVNYVAYTNPDDRSGTWKAPKLSLAAPLLAAAHAGAVVPIAYDVDWMGTYFNYSTETTIRPNGAPSGDKWRLGTMTPVTTTYDFCITVIANYYQYVNIDFNDNGNYGDAGEGPFLEAENELAFDGVMFQVITGVPGEFHGPGDVTLIYPTASEMVDDLGTYFTTNGGHPEYLCIVGAFDTMPYGTQVYWGGGIIGVGDALISNVDDDVFVELATGRIVALDVVFGTLQATRSSTYNNLVNDNWKKKVVLMGGGALNMLRYATRYLQNVGFDAPYELDRHFNEGEQVYMQNRSVISHSWHSCQFGWGWGPGYGVPEPNLDEYLLEPSIAESGGCLTEAIHCYNTTPWQEMVSLQILRRGAICHLGCTATASSCYETPRTAFWIGIAAGDTLGQAWKKGAITTEYCALADISPGWDDEAPVVLFGDPAVGITIPSSPTQTPAHVDVDGTILTAVAPTFTLGTYDDPENPQNIYTYYGPGTYPEYWAPASNYLASYTTDGTITNMTETTSCPGTLGWPATDAWYIDQHQDGTETVYWRVRFLEWQDVYNSTIVNQLSSIAYQVTVTVGNDTDPPTPNPATFASAPAAVSDSEITMTATTGTDVSNPVKYFFDETSGNPGGTDSGWVTNPVYNDTGLSASTQYTYTVQMRDAMPTPNVGTVSSPASATTPADSTSPTPNPMTWAAVPYDTGSTSILMVATSASDPSGVEYYFTCTAGGGHNSGWQDQTTYEDTGLTPETQYTYTVTARDKSTNQNATTASIAKSATTDPSDTTAVTVPNSGFETIYKPNSTTITATITGWTQGVGPDCPIDSGVYTFSDQTTGTLGDIPGWLGYDKAGWIALGGTYGRDQTTGNLQGSVSTGNNHTPSGAYCYLVNGGDWGNPAGGLITSEASLGNIASGATYKLSMYANGADGAATPVVLNLLANGTVVTPTSSVDPTLTDTHQKFIRIYDVNDLTSYTGQAIKIVCGIGRNAAGTQTHMDDVSLIYYVSEDTDPPTPNPATFASAPAAVSSSQITMTATTGSDATGPVQYYFDETSGNPGGTDSGWVTNPVYNDTGLSPSTQYTYTVKMRDSVTPTPNVGTASSPASATTPAAPAPTFVAAGAVKSGTGAISPALPSGIAANDILLLFVETANQAVSISNQNGGTWAAVTGSPQGTGTAGDTSATRLTVFWSRYNGTQGAPTVSDSGNHQAARMIAIRGAVSSGNPWNVTAGGVDATSDTSASIPGATTTVINTLVVVATAGSLPDANGTAQFSAWTNANLTSLTERTDNSVSAGNGGSLGIATGIKATAGAYGNTAATHANSAVKGMISIAIRP
jgi:hypothetical protein